MSPLSRSSSSQSLTNSVAIVMILDLKIFQKSKELAKQNGHANNDFLVRFGKYPTIHQETNDVNQLKTPAQEIKRCRGKKKKNSPGVCDTFPG